MEISKLVEFTFFLNGLSSLIGFNAIICSLDYFGSIYTQFDVNKWFTVPFNVGGLFVALIYHTLQKKYSLSYLINFGLITYTVCLGLLVLTSVFYKQDQATGFYISMGLIFIVGVNCTMAQLCFYGMINYLSGTVITMVMVGSSVSSLVTSSIRIMVIAIKGSNSGNMQAILIYFVLTLTLNIIDIILNNKFFAS